MAAKSAEKAWRRKQYQQYRKARKADIEISRDGNGGRK